MNVLSLFNGLGSLWIALDKLNIKVDKRYSSEIDKYVNIVNDKNYPDTIQLGDIVKLRRYLEKPELYERMLMTSFVKQENKELIYHCIDLLLDDVDILAGGSPCQGFSFAGKQLNFNDPRSKLFFEFVKIKNILKPKYFLLENVKMKKEYQDIISEFTKAEPIEINSALVSAQNRKRLYWTNIEGIEQPKDKGIFLKDILEDNSNKVGRMVGRKINSITGKRDDYNKDLKIIQRVESRLDNKAGCLTTVQKDNLVLKDFNHTDKALTYMNRKVKGGRTHWDFGYIQSLDKDKSQCLTANIYKGILYNVLVDSKPSIGCIKENPKVFRKLTPIECERLQTISDNFTNSVSNSQRYKMIGNGWTIDVIVHIFSYIK